MKPTSELVYSNDLCSAFLTAVVKSFETHHPKSYLGRTAMQKLAYFAQVLDVPIPCSFGIYTYGPYSDKVSFAVESLLADEVVEDESPNSAKYSNYRLGPNADEILTQFGDDLRPHQDTIDRVVAVLGGFDPRELELVSTLHFVARRQQQIRRRAIEKKAVIAEFKSIKKDKFTDSDIAVWYDALDRANLI